MNATRLPAAHHGFRAPHRVRTFVLEALVACLALGVWSAGYIILCPPSPSHYGQHDARLL